MQGIKVSEIKINRRYHLSPFPLGLPLWWCLGHVEAVLMGHLPVISEGPF
jgi:hypothetical protein